MDDGKGNLFDVMFVVGRYNKLSRNLCQTPWIIDGKRKMNNSVQEIIYDAISQFIQCESK